MGSSAEKAAHNNFSFSLAHLSSVRIVTGFKTFTRAEKRIWLAAMNEDFF